MTGSMVYRLRVSAADDPHMVKFRQAMNSLQSIQDSRGYNHIAGLHGVPGWYCWHHQTSRRSPVQARLFLPWHRAYLWWLEQAMQDQVAGTALPWWDWTRDRKIPNAYAARRVDNAHNPLFNFRMRVPSARPPINRNTQRDPAQLRLARLPTADQINAVRKEPDWPSFSDALQNYHDHVHGWVGGDMRNTATAGFDPVFYAHHAMIDRIWYLWQVEHGNGGIPIELLDLELMPFGKRVRDVLDVQTLGYEYAATVVNVDVNGEKNG